MGYFKAGKQKEKEIVNKETVQDILKYPFVEAKDRKVSKATCEKFGIRAALSEKDGKTVEAYYFPSYDQKGKIAGFTKQDVTKHKSEKGHWSTVGSVTIGNKLFGQDVAEEVQRKKNVIVVTEGQWDCVSSFQALVDNVKGTKYEGLEPFVVSIPMGTGNAVEALLHNESFIQKYDGLCLFFDNDHATPAELKKGILKGKEAREAVAAAFIGAGLSITTVIAEGEYKDASDYLQDGESESLAKLIQFGKQVYAAEKIVRASEIDLEELLAPQKPGFMVKCFPKLMKGLNGLRESELTLFLAPSNVGKCHGKGQEILMYDLSTKKVEDIVVGDIVMGRNGQARNVLATHSGVDTIYKVVPNKGLTYTVNGKHILCLQPNSTVKSRGMVKDEDYFISAEDFYNIPKHYKEHVLSGVFTDLKDYGNGYDSEAYILGLWLAEGSKNDTGFTLSKQDLELHEELKKYAEKYDYSLSVAPSNDRQGSTTYRVTGGFRDKLRDWGVYSEKEIPEKFFHYNWQTRMELLAGFVDGDGHVSNGCVELCLKKNKLAQDVVKLARTVGLQVRVVDKFSKCQNFDGEIYSRILLVGNTQNIPNRLSRKKVTKTPNRNPMRTGITIENIGKGEYYGFEVDGDNLYCLPDYQLTHNTTVCSILGAEIMDDFHLGMIYLEEDKRETFLRQIASKLKVNYLKFKENPLSVASREEIQAVYDDIAQNNKLAIVDHFGSMPVDGLMNKIKHLHLVEGCRFIILDHISMVVSGTETDNERKELDIVMTALASFCAANPVHVLVISHINRTNAQQFLPPKGSEGEPFWVNVTKESARGSSALEACSWNIVALEPEVMPDFSRGRVRFKILKTRFGNFLGIADVFTLDKETWQPILEEDTTQNF